ncbi:MULTISPECIES: methyltransferase domain-containing protein [unclassified Pseudomonas]|uniref:class I SAM-dependent methyltransferase n=1 Tax=unclassified Pseudomonas TaxID=196821 RepID=UPI000A1F0C6C|nr:MULTISPECIES: methyltransferase domain-containing protein [unclassified Pseudomonas]
MAQTDQKLHLGCGSVTFPGWINIDLDSPTADRLLDLTEPLPFADSSVSHIFNEHFIEHVTREQAVAFLKECFRVLTPGGAIRITTPNLRFLTHSYFSDSKNEWGDLWQPNSRCQMMNEGMRSWGHQFVYDAEEMTRAIGEAGFKSIVFQSYRKSADEVFSGLESRPFHNELIVEARKSSAVDVDVDFSAVTENEATWLSSGAGSVQANEHASVKTALESAARAEFIEVQSARIREVEAELLAQQALVQQQAGNADARVAEVASISQSLAAQVQVNEALKSQLDEARAELQACQTSWCGRIKSFFNRTAQ